MKSTGCCISLYLLCFVLALHAQPASGDVFREYTWFNKVDECDFSLRVGGRLDYRLTGNALPVNAEGKIQPDFDVKLEHARKAELVVEKMLCHEGTEGLRVSVNGNTPLPFPDSPHIPSPQSAYAHHYNGIIPVDLSILKEGRNNCFVFDVDTAGHWWPQNLVYGMVLRIYYDPSSVTGRSEIIAPASGDTMGREVEIALEHTDPEQVQGIDIVGYYEDADLEGDGLYRQWHYAYHKGKIYNHIGSLEPLKEPYTWNTEWIPDQNEPMKLAAFVHLKNGYTYMTDAVKDLVLDRPGYSVELCKPYQRPRHWFTRNGEFGERFQVKGDIAKITEARLVFRSWSPGYFNGIYINDFLVFIKEGPNYAYFEHHIPIETHVLEAGENMLKTGMTPKYHGQMVHGAEIQWPGIMVLIKYEEENNKPNN
jgi:hypothetical protein